MNSRIFALVILLMSSLHLLAQEYMVALVPGKTNPALLCTTISFQEYQIDNVIIDTGSTTTQLNHKDFVTLKKNGLLSSANLLGEVKTRDCNGVITAKQKYRIPLMSIGGIKIRNLEVIFDKEENASRLLGLNFFRLFRNVSIDFNEKTLVLIK